MEFLAGVRVSECSRSAKYGIANFLLFLSLNNKGLFKKENRDDVFALAAGDLMWHGRLWNYWNPEAMLFLLIYHKLY